MCLYHEQVDYIYFQLIFSIVLNSSEINESKIKVKWSNTLLKNGVEC